MRDSPFVGRWHIGSMSSRDGDALEVEVRALIEFDKKDGGSFQFGYVQGVIACREGLRRSACGGILVGGWRWL